jgi:hypothetical protein
VRPHQPSATADADRPAFGWTLSIQLAFNRALLNFSYFSFHCESHVTHAVPVGLVNQHSTNTIPPARQKYATGFVVAAVDPGRKKCSVH